MASHLNWRTDPNSNDELELYTCDVDWEGVKGQAALSRRGKTGNWEISARLNDESFGITKLPMEPRSRSRSVAAHAGSGTGRHAVEARRAAGLWIERMAEKVAAQDADTVQQEPVGADGVVIGHMGIDAKRWAQSFMRMLDDWKDLDEGTMTTWFANAIETGRSAGRTEFDSGDMTWEPASAAKFETLVVPKPHPEPWQMLFIEVPKPELFDNTRWFRFKADVHNVVAQMIEDVKLFEDPEALQK